MKSLLKRALECLSPALAKELRFRAIKSTPLSALKDRRLFEPELLLIKLLLCETKGLCLDIGAHVGEYCYALEQCIPPNQIYAFEPNPETGALLRRFFPHIHVENIALSNMAGIATLSVPRSGNKTYATRGTLEHSDPHDTTIVVPLTTIDDLASGWQMPVSFMKIDVEGHENKVLAGGRKTILRDHPIMLIEIEERHSGIPITETFREIEALGYCGYFLDLRAGSFLPVHTFDPTVRQRTENMKSADYINNFLFFPEGDAKQQMTSVATKLFTP